MESGLVTRILVEGQDREDTEVIRFPVYGVRGNKRSNINHMFRVVPKCL